MEVKANLDLYKILCGRDEYSMRVSMLDAIELEAEYMANKEGFSFKYTIIDGKVYRQSDIIR